jgi:hypothetical protein
MDEVAAKSGGFPKDHDHACPTCSGAGEVTAKDAEGWHFTDCETCLGAGTLPYRVNPRMERTVEPPHDHASEADAAAAQAGSKG